MSDLISRQDAIDAIDVLCQEYRYRIPGKAETYSQYNEAWQDALGRAEGVIGDLPSVDPEPKKGEWTTEEVAELLSNLFGDECACNYNGIDEWLPERCKYTEIAGECPNPKEKHGCWMQFLLQGGAGMRGEQDE